MRKMVSSPEFRLAAACAMWPPSDHRCEAIRNAAAGPLDWARFIGVTERHRIIGLAHDGLTRAHTNVPRGAVCEIGARAESLLRKNLVRAGEALRLQALFDQAKVPVLFLKGASLAALAFGNVGLVGGHDIDIWVPPETLSEATALITRAGYLRCDPPAGLSEKKLRRLMPLRKDFVFVHRSSGILIELHWRLFLNPHAMDHASILAESQIVPLSATEGLRTMGNADLFTYLCFHGALHWWNRLKWLADLNAFVSTAAPRDGVENLIRAANVKGAGRAAAQAMLLRHRLLDAPLPSPVISNLSKKATVRWLEATALSAMATGEGQGSPHNVRFGTTRGSLSTFLLGQSWRYRLAELNIQFTSQRDVANILLPEKMQFLYPFLRLPLWVGRHARKRTS